MFKFHVVFQMHIIKQNITTSVKIVKSMEDGPVLKLILAGQGYFQFSYTLTGLVTNSALDPIIFRFLCGVL